MASLFQSLGIDKNEIDEDLQRVDDEIDEASRPPTREELRARLRNKINTKAKNRQPLKAGEKKNRLENAVRAKGGMDKWLDDQNITDPKLRAIVTKYLGQSKNGKIDVKSFMKEFEEASNTS